MLSVNKVDWILLIFCLESFYVRSGTFIPKAGCEDNRNVEYVCDKDKNFPSTKMQKIIENLKSEHKIALKAFSKAYRPIRIPSKPDNIVADAPGESGVGGQAMVGREVCPFAQQIHYPQKAKNKNNKWR